jgi:DNA-binding GntR family transcriptional regulator
VTDPSGPGERLSRNGTFSQRTESVLRDMILDGRLPPGERLNEVALASALGISRGPLREAIQRLASEGLLRVVSHRGAFVRTFERAEVEELYDVRAALEMYVARLVCERASDADIAELRSMLDATAASMSDDPATAYPEERDLHARLLALGSHAEIQRVLQETQRQISLARSMSAKAPARAREALAEHEDLVTAIEARDGDKAAAIMRLHLQRACEGAVNALGLEAGPE